MRYFPLERILPCFLEEKWKYRARKIHSHGTFLVGGVEAIASLTLGRAGAVLGISSCSLFFSLTTLLRDPIFSFLLRRVISLGKPSGEPSPFQRSHDLSLRRSFFPRHPSPRQVPLFLRCSRVNRETPCTAISCI